MTHPVEDHYRRRHEAAKKIGGNAIDFYGLDQGPVSSQARYELLAATIRGIDGRVVDVACGTGAMIETWHGLGVHPGFVLGLDGLIENGALFDARMERLKQPAGFQYTPMSLPFWEVAGVAKYDAAICTGLVGFHGYHTYRQIAQLHLWMGQVAPHGAIMIPLVYSPDHQGDDHIRRYPIADIKEVLGQVKIEALEREFLVHW